MLKAVLHIDCDMKLRGGIPVVLECIEQLRRADPEAAIVVIATGRGILQLQASSRMSGLTKDITAAMAKGVWFVACADSVRRYEEEGQFLGETSRPNLMVGVRTVPFGVASILELQAQGYGYIVVTSQEHVN